MSQDRARSGERTFEVISLLAESGPLTTSEIADATGVSASWVRDILTRARKNNYVESDGGGFTPVSGVSPKEHSVTDRGRDYLSYKRDQMDS